MYDETFRRDSVLPVARNEGYTLEAATASLRLVVLGRTARLQFEDRAVEPRPGDHVCLASGQRDRTEWKLSDEPRG
ncbi:hypothetical protein Pla175_23320 [Pirellulimonas nuda]|uniref:Uncharacterized protein n=2 Tax=Pirellulimonas nuda TaxID=2528009 RepID=A0A518DBV7_9BACT|nr:hypothetical protein Pla175_23320 [Pirellulimonas nuda]